MDPHSPVPRSTRGHARRRIIVGMLAGLLVLGAMLLIVVSPALAPPTSFPDVAASHPYYTAIMDLAARSIIQGYTNGNFGPGDPVKRQQFAKMIVLTAGYPVSASDICPFPDVEQSTPPDLYPDHYVAVAAAHGITVGTTPGIFSPYDPISRYQVISMVVRAADDIYPGLLSSPTASWSGTPGWGDNPTHGENARRAEFNGLLTRLALSSLDPWGDMPRGEVAQVLHNLLTLLPPTSTTTTTQATTTTTQANTTTSASTTTTTTEPFEASPSWNLADLSVTMGRIEPERVDSGVPVHIQAVISNVGTGSAGEFQVVLLVDGELAGRQGMDGLGALASTDLTFEWPAEGPGRHVIRVAVSEHEGLDGSPDNDQADGAVWVSGEDPPVPDLEVIPPEFDLLQLQAGESRRLVFRIRNPSFAVVQEVPVRFWIDQIPASSDWIRHLDPGEYQDFEVPWDDVAPGEHVVAVQMILPETFPDAVERAIATFRVILPGTSVLYSSPGVDKWASLGPSYLTNGDAGGPTGSTGRMDCIAIDPSYHPTMYAGSPTGGIWKTNNGGLSWWPVGDKLPSLHIGSIAVDPRRPSHVYAGTWDKGVFKSVDGGNTWSPFAAAFRDPGGGEHAMRSVRRIFLRYIDPESDQLLIYLATDDGVLRCILNDPSHTATLSSEWALIKSGIVQDMDVSPADSWVVYASISRATVVNGYWVSVHDGIYRTTVGGYATESDWTLLTQGLPATAGMQVHHVVDIYPANPAVLYTAVNEPESGVSLALYKSTDGGDTWSLAKTIFKPNPDGGIDGLYNPFVRVQPVNENIVYVGGVGLYRLNLAIGQTVEVTGLHVDQKTLEFIPDEPTRYYALNDGGVWRGTVNGRPPTDLVEPRNQDLRTIQFYDVDCSASNSDVMVGGTQDNGTLVFTGGPVWRAILGGDGNFSIISRQNDLRIYAQHQFLTDTRRTDQGVNADYFGSHYDWMACATGLPSGDDWYVKTAFITLDPDDDTHVLAQGPEVYETKNSGASWSPVGPRGANVKGGITRIQFRPGAGSRIWAVGTSRGQVWLRNTGGSYDFIDEHPQDAAVESLTFAPTDPGVLYVLYRGGAAYLRLWRYEETSPGNWMAGNVTDTLPQNVDALVVCGDPYDRDIAYLGTTRGVYRGDGHTGWWAWDDYNDGLPLVEVKDLLVDPTSRQLRAGTFGRGAWAVIPGSAENPPLTLTDLKGPDWESHLRLSPDRKTSDNDTIAAIVDDEASTLQDDEARGQERERRWKVIGSALRLSERWASPVGSPGRAWHG